MTEDEMRAAILEALRPLARWVADHADELGRIDDAIAAAGERMADEAEAFANQGDA